MAIFKDHVKFPTLQRGSDGNVIVDFHPEYFDPSATAAERLLSTTSPVLTALFGHYAFILQNGDQVWLVDGFGTCYTMNIQAKFENKKGQATCTESVTSKRFINQQIYCI
jgi:hypothetical protein